jgi:hypothetical protein
MNYPTRKPPLSKELLAFLNETYPDTLPRSTSLTERDLAYLQGQRSVVDFIINLFEQDD